jgi:hypothetical protein
MVVRVPSATPHDVVDRIPQRASDNVGTLIVNAVVRLPGGGGAVPALDHDNPCPTWSYHVDLHMINDGAHDQ